MRERKSAFCEKPFASRVAVIAPLIVFWMLHLVSRLEAQQPNEFQVKAAYLYNFGKFVEWPAGIPAGQNDSFVVCVLGKDPFGPTLDSTFANERIGGKSVLARRISKPVEAMSCKILFISTSESVRLKEILAAVEKSGVLTVSDIPQFSKLGGMIQFVLEGSKIRFEINRTKAESAGLALSSDLLKVASLVRVGP
jgi:YfiR/HmsC-like